MDSWQDIPTEMVDLSQSGVPYNPDDWEEWLRWDPTTELLSPENSSKDSTASPHHDAAPKGDSFPLLVADETLAPPLVVGDDVSMLDIQGAMDKPSFHFSQADDGVSPFVFGSSHVNQPSVDHLPPDLDLNTATYWPHGDQGALMMPNDVQHLGVSVGAQGQGLESSHLPSPHSVSQPRTSVSSDSSEPMHKKTGRKRKTSSGDESKRGTSGSPAEGEPPVKKTSHNVIEKRYRNNLNDKIAELRDSVPSLRAMSRPSGEDDSEDLGGLAPAHKLNKSTIMAKATEYIKHLEKRNKTMGDEMATLKSRMESLEKTFARSSATHGKQSAASGRALSPVATRSTQPSSHLQTGPDQRRMRPAEQQQYLQRHATPQYEAQPGNDTEAGYPQRVNAQGGKSVMGKLMVGSMAGLMVMEGFHEHEQNAQSPSGRGLYAVPTGFFRRGEAYAGSGSLPPVQALLPLFKLALLFGALLYLVLPLFSRKAHPRRKAAPQLRLSAAPSLASPVEIRRKAWLTAVQSVWVPKHFLLEVVAVAEKMLKLSLRRLIGSEYYSVVSGTTKDEEAARIKAWDIAIDAQLAGGDAEISYYRLLLTLMASGTLPDSPVRLMQKAVHFRVFFWEIANAGYGNVFMFRDFTAKVAKIYWDSARAQQKSLTTGGPGSAQDESGAQIEMLPEHLAHLIELDSDDVLTDDMIQRAYNLAWDRPSAEKTARNWNMDSVVEDHAIRSPLDAIAAWYTNMTIDDALARSLDADRNMPSDVACLVNLATATAPPASGTQTRAFVVRAILIDEDREAHIAAAVATVPSARTTLADLKARTTSSTIPMNLTDQTPVSPDIRTALSLAKLLSLAAPANPLPARIHGAAALASLDAHMAGITLLTAAASHKVLRTFASDAVLFNAGKLGLEELASVLRVWVGTRQGRSAGLGRARKTRLVENCLWVAKKAGGWKDDEDGDSGYASVGVQEVEKGALA